MFRRSRFSARPNVGTGGRGAAATATPQEAAPANREASEPPADTSESSTAPNAEIEVKSDVTSEKPAAPEDGNDQNGEGTSSSAAVQRRKRFSVKPRVAPGRPPTLPRTPKSPIKSVSETPVESSGTGVETSPQAVSTRSGNAAATQGLLSPRRRRSSEGSKSPRVQPKPAVVLDDSSEPSVVPPAEDLPDQTHLPSASSSQSEKTSDCQAKEGPPVRHPEKVPPSLPDRETNEISEKAKSLVTSKTALSLTASSSLSRLLNGPSDLQRLIKAQKLRELLRQERCKEKTLKKAKARSKEYSLDPAKMTMRDLIHYLPTSNPMSCSLEDSVQENETLVPPSPLREASPEPAQEPIAPSNNTTNPREEEEEGEDDQEEALMVPQVKVAEDGSLIIDEESLTVEVQRAKGPNPAQDRDPIFERGSTTTYSSFRKGSYTKPWSAEETDMFFLAVSMVGTDFSMIGQLFPHRARSEIKNKFKKEEKLNSWRIDKAFKERRKLDIEYFSKLLEKVMEVNRNRKKLKSLAQKNAPKQRKAPAKKRARTLSNVEEVDEEDEDEVPDVEEEGEKENEDLCNEGGAPAAEPKRKNKRKKRADASTEDRQESGEAGVSECAEAALPEDHTNADISQDTVTDKNLVIKPAKLSRARAPKPTLPLGRKWGKKTAPPTKPREAASDEEDENVDGSTHEEQVNKDASASSEASKRNAADDDMSDEEEDLTVKPPKPTRYGRVPKPTKPLTYSDKDDSNSCASETSAPAAKPKAKCTAKRGRTSKQQSSPKSKKPKLVTLRASQSDLSDEENDGQWGGEELEVQQLPFSSSLDNSASEIVPTGLHTLQSEISEVDDSMVELDILASMPDVLGMSDEALCPDSSCGQAQHGTDTAEPCEHQLDLLVDVIDFLSTEHTEDNLNLSEEQSYNEAAQTLLAIGNVAHITQAAPSQDAIGDYKEGTSEDNNEPTSIEDQIPPRPAAEEESAPSVFAQFRQDVTKTSETATTVEVEVTEAHAVSGDVAVTSTSGQERTEQQTVVELEPELLSIPESSNNNHPLQTNKGRFSNKKPKPNLTQTSRTAQSKSQPESSSGEASHAGAPCQGNAATTAAVEIAPETQDSAPTTLKANVIDEPSHQEMIVGQVETGAVASEVQSHLSAEFQVEPSRLTTVDTNVTSDSRDEKLASVETSETSLKDPPTCDSAVTEVTQEAVIDLTADTSTDNVPPAEDSPVRKDEESEVQTTRQSRRGRLPKIKPNLQQTSRTARSKDETPKPVETRSASEFINENPTSCSQTSEAVPETEARQKTDVHSSPKQEDRKSSVVAATPVEEVRPTQEECNAAPTCQTRRSRFQKVKPNIPQMARTERSKPQTREDLNVGPGSDVEPQPTCVLAPEQLNQTTDPASTVDPRLNLDSTPKELTPDEDKHACPEPPNQTDLSSSTIEERTSESKNLSESQFSAAIEQNIREPESTPKISDEILPAEVKPAEISCEDMLTTDSSVTESQVTQQSNANSTSAQFQTGQDEDSAEVATCVQESPASQEDSQVASTSQVRRGRSQKVRPKPILPSIPRTARSERQTTSESVEKESSPSPKVEVEPKQPHKEARSESTPPASTLSSSCDLISPAVTTDELATKENNNSCTEQGTTQNVSQRRRFSRVKHKPNLGSSAPTAQTKPQSPDISQPADHSLKDTSSSGTTEQSLGGGTNAQGDLELVEKSDEHLPPAHSSSKEAPTSVKFGGEDCNLGRPDAAAETNIQQIIDPAADSSKEGSTESVVVSTDTSSQCLEGNSSVKSTDDVKSELTDSPQTSKKAPQPHRGRLIKPKPTLGSRTRRVQPQEAKDSAPAEPESGSCLPDVDASADQKLVAELRPDTQEPGEGVTDELQHPDPPQGDIAPSTGLLAKSDQSPQGVAETSPRQIESSSSEGFQTHPLLQDMLPDSVPSDPDEPFFILSLTAVPVSSSGEVAPSAAEPPPFLTATPPSVQQPSVSGESLVPAGEQPVFNVVVSTEESADTGLPRGKDKGTDAAAANDFTVEDPESSQGTGSVSVEPQKSPQTPSSSEAPVTPEQQKPGGRAKSQVKPRMTRKKKKQTSEALDPEEAESDPSQAAQDSEHAGTSVEPGALDQGVTELQKERSCKVDAESEREPDVGSSAQTTRRTRTRMSARSKTKAAPASTPPPSKAASSGSKAKAPSAKRKQSCPESAASTSHGAAIALQPKEIHAPTITSPPETKEEQTSDTSSSFCHPTALQCPAEVSDSQESGSFISSFQESEEPISVSQYFLSDIFTEVENE
ncbi:transcription factor TFIIIB component B'' homolog [Salarias fasciatus]|uniref:Myb-like domain-containing protein n=1 Tax=Salarias fasciatus TaxID=181472 RepID=A0A672IN54_SALFA|nr:transcription factor TFIIIB component B'' homolog [Salarias fasciatus]XP_029941116.1 transcription factor TFIIIB component B'' homolog [Salarias fasciatus]